jgi:hypothetical protein
MLANPLSKTQALPEEVGGMILEQDRVFLGGENYSLPESTFLEENGVLSRGSSGGEAFQNSSRESTQVIGMHNE